MKKKNTTSTAAQGLPDAYTAVATPRRRRLAVEPKDSEFHLGHLHGY